MSDTATLGARIEKLQETLTRLYALDRGWKMRKGWPEDVNGPILHPPATEEQIAAAEETLGFAFPPSYREFLLLHNGWEHFFWDFTLVAIGAGHTPAACEEILENVNYQRERSLPGTIKDLGKPAIADWESKNPVNLFLGNHLVVGTDFIGDLWVYDTRTRQIDGEMTLVFWSLESGAWENPDRRFANFHDFLEWAQKEADVSIRQVEEHTAEQGTKSAKSARPAKKNSP